jgi:hypothetical protein
MGFGLHLRRRRLLQFSVKASYLKTKLRNHDASKRNTARARLLEGDRTARKERLMASTVRRQRSTGQKISARLLVCLLQSDSFRPTPWFPHSVPSSSST